MSVTDSQCDSTIALPVRTVYENGQWISHVPGTSIYSSGETQEEAFDLIFELSQDMLEFYERMQPWQFGPGPLKDFKVLKSYWG
jgi:hypothetical protein